MTDDQVRNAVHTAIAGVVAEIPPLDFRAAHERSTAHRLAVHLERPFDTWNVDCEYDRDGQIRKALLGIAGCSPLKETDWILPDIIVHHRQRPGREHNLLVVELKKNADEDQCDQRKLELFTAADGHYQYQLGLFINIKGGGFDCTWYKDAAQLR